MGLFSSHKSQMVTPEQALSGRDGSMPVTEPHLVLGTKLTPPFPEGLERAVFAMGCFWGAERMFWALPGVYTTAVGYAGGFTRNPMYKEVCGGRTGHAEAVVVVYDPAVITYEQLLRVFFEGHDPTQGMRQGNDVGTQYRSAIYTNTPEQAAVADEVAARFSRSLHDAGYGDLTTEIRPAGDFFYAEPYHQQYLEANPNGYCGLGSTGVSCPVGLAEAG
ncbi:MAG TPA: peptide-methionine (S)-S-oxide reductase MsrA [Acidimicrobiales bacterium]|jgi:peptide-methionine (S)-S-oxide reductase